MRGFSKVLIPLVFVVLLLVSQPAAAQPTFQVWSPDYDFFGTWGADEDTWFVTSPSFELWVAGAYHPNEESLTDVTLLVSVPDGQTGAISISGLYGNADPVLITVGADADPIGPDTGYTTTAFLPANFNNHFPLHDDVADFLIYDIGDFAPDVDDIYDYNADDGTITPTGSRGEVKEYQVAVDGFDWVHFDAYGLVTSQIDQKWVATWEISPGSHDTTFIPAPGAVLLGGMGVSLVGWLRRRRTF